MPSPLTSMLKTPAEGDWRVGHTGRHGMYYEEWRDEKWQRLEIDGEMLLGQPHHIIYFGPKDAWNKKPTWAHHRRDEIIDRIKTKFRTPDYEYDGESILSEADQASLIAAVGGLSNTPCRWVNCSSLALQGKQFCVVHSFGPQMWRPSGA